MTETHDLVTRLLAAIEAAEQDSANRSCGAVHAQFDTHHPAGHPDEPVLRHCAADREIVELHGQDHECPQAASAGHPALTGWYAEKPCPTLLAKARGYGLAEQQEDQP